MVVFNILLILTFYKELYWAIEEITYIGIISFSNIFFLNYLRRIIRIQEASCQ
jgi:hypothetical protein